MMAEQNETLEAALARNVREALAEDLGTGDWTAGLVGVSYPPSLLFMLAILALLIKVLLEDLEVSTNRRRLLRLAQKTAILEQEVRELRGAVEEQKRDG